MPTIQSRDGTLLHFEIHGNGPVNLIFLHGWGGDSTTWDDVIARLDGACYRLISLDLRGHGKSEAPVTGYTIQDFSDDVMAVADHVDAETFVPVGFSMGGKLACYVADTNPGRISRLVLVAPAGPGIVPIDRASGLQACREANDWRKNEVVFKDWFAPRAGAEMVKGYCKTIARTSLQVLEATAEVFLWTSLVSDVGRLKQRALLVIGSRDPVYGMAYQEKEMLPFLDAVTMATLACGHFIPLERPSELAEKIAATV